MFSSRHVHRTLGRAVVLNPNFRDNCCGRRGREWRKGSAHSVPEVRRARLGPPACSGGGSSVDGRTFAHALSAPESPARTSGLGAGLGGWRAWAGAGPEWVRLARGQRGEWVEGQPERELLPRVGRRMLSGWLSPVRGLLRDCVTALRMTWSEGAKTKRPEPSTQRSLS